MLRVGNIIGFPAMAPRADFRGRLDLRSSRRRFG